ncbi:MAG: hypothetical protein HY331_05250 [Chloroflexi bacterium]|nr:hypothetical protein [Chloroflexota bacterium]
MVYIVDSNQHRIRKISATSAEPGWIDQTPPGIVPHVGGVSALDANTVWAVGSARTILKTTNGGVTWAPQQPITGAGLTDVDVVDANTVWVVGDASPDSGCGDGETGCGLVLKTTDGGATWTARTFPRGYFPGSPHLTAVSAVDANTVWAVGFCGAVIKTVDGGANWLNLSGGCVYFSDVAAIDANTAWASAVSGVYKTTNGGASWSLVYPSAVALHSIAAVGPSVAWAVSQGGTIVKTIDGGANWITQTSGTTVTLGGITALDAANVWAVGENGTILRTADGGTHWVVQPSGTTLGLNGLTVVGPGTAWAVGGDGGTKGTILKCCVRPTTSTTAPGTANDLLWTTRASMPTRKDFFGAAVLNGKLFVVGGRNSDGALATVDEYDPAANTWSPRAPLPSARSHLALVAADNGKLYAIGGLDYVVGRVQGNATVATVDEYDPATNSWTTRASMPTSRAAMAVAVSNGRIFAIGGWSGPVPDNARPTPLAVVEEYDPSTNTWLARTPMPTPRYTLGAAVDPDGKLYAIGGSPDNVTSVATVEEYDPINNTWRNRAPMPTNRLGLGMAEASNGRLYAIGGSPGGAVLATVEEYDPSTNTWTTRASMPTARAGASAISMPNGSLYVVGGNDGYDYVATVEEATFVGGTRLVGTQANRILPGDTAAYTMAVDTRGSAPGTYARTLTFRTSDPARPTATVRVAGVITTTGPLTSTPGVSTLPDLAVSPADVAFGSPSPTEGETVPITATIQNGGGGDSGGLAVSFFATAAGWGETLIGSAFVTNVPARGTAQATIRWNTLGFVGSVPVRVVADPFRRVAESDEGNNSAAAGIAVRTRPDLSVAGIALSDAEPVDSQAVTVTLALPNTGQTTAVTHTVALYDGNPSAGGVPIGDVTLPPLPGGETRTVEVVWTPARLGAHRLFAVSDRANAVAESDEGNNQAWRDVAVGFRGPILVDSGTAADLAYTADRGYGYVDTGYTDERVSCGEAPHETLRRDPSGQVSYRFDHLQPGRFYHLNLTLYECSPAGRQETVEVDGNPVTGTVVLGGGQPQRLSLRLDPALYADRSITVSVKAPVIEGGAIVNEVKLSDVDYRYVDAGGGNDLAYTPARGYGYLDGIADPSVTTQTLPYQSFRVNQNGDTLRYQFDRLDPGRRYQVHLTFWQPAGTTARVQSVRINGADTGVVVDSGDNQPHRVTLDVPPSVYATSGSIVVGVVRSGGLAGPLVNEIALEERTDTTGLAELPTPTPTPTPTATTTATPTPTGSPTPSPTPTATPTTTGTAAPNEVLDVRQSNVTDVSFTLSFLSKLPAIAAVRYWVSGTTPSSAPVAEDFRTAPGETHRVRVPTSLDALDRLTPETAYRYTVHLDGALDPVYTGTVRTGPTLGGETPREAFGRVVALSGSPVGAALVYLTVERAGDQAASALLSAATDADGYWWIGLGGARTQDLAAPFSYSTADLARLEVTAGSAGAAAGSRAVGGPWPITLALQAVAQRSISLGFGWNAVALPLAPTEPISASQVAGLANGDGSTRMSGAFRFVSGLWQGGTYTGTAFVGDDFPLHPGEGYFFRMQSPFVWGLAGQPITGAVPLHLETGWNLVGAPAPAGLRARHLSDEAGTISDTTSYNVRQVARWILGGYEGHVSGYPFNNFPITDTAAYFVQATVSGTLVPGTSGYFPFDSVPALSAAGASARVAMAQRDAVLPSRRRWAAWRSFGQRRLSER